MRTGRLYGLTTIVTGAGSGIGRAVATRFAEEGAVVVAADVDEQGARETASVDADHIHPMALDVTDPEQIDAVVAWIDSELGGLDVIVNNAGILLVGPLHDIDPASWDRGFDVNVKGAYLVTRATWPGLVARGGGSIVNAGSVAGLQGVGSNAGYCAAKGAVVLMSKAAALDGAPHRIRVNCVCPGFTETPMIEAYFADQDDPDRARQQADSAHPLGLGRPRDIADAYVYLASSESSWVTGSALVVDGGYTAG